MRFVAKLRHRRTHTIDVERSSSLNLPWRLMRHNMPPWGRKLRGTTSNIADNRRQYHHYYRQAPTKETLSRRARLRRRSVFDRSHR